jgi:Spy/CpxP family protein refolding chaperone
MFRRELGLTAEQSSRLEDIFQKSMPTLRKQKEALDRAQAEFDRLVENAADNTVMDQVDAVEAARAELNKARVMMLLRMRRSLTADQWAKFTALQQQREANRPDRPNPR